MPSCFQDYLSVLLVPGHKLLYAYEKMKSG